MYYDYGGKEYDRSGLFNRKIMSKNLKEKIIKTSYRMFKENGYTQVTIMDICKELNISKPTFYNYVKSKEELLTIFYNDMEEEMSKRILEIISQENYWKQILCAFQIIMSHSQEFGHDLYSQLFISNLKENKGTFQFQEGITKLMTTLFEKAQNANQIQNLNDPKELYLACAHLAFGYGIIWCLEGGKEDLLKNFEHGLIQVLEVNPAFL